MVSLKDRRLYSPGRFLVLAKTYPNPSARYQETVCVAAITPQCELVRLYPIKFRYLSGAMQFRKWDWIRARTRTPSDDRRPESRRVDMDSLIRDGDSVGTENGWASRRYWLESNLFPSMGALDLARRQVGTSLGVLKVDRLVDIKITSEPEPEWDEKQLAYLRQGQLLDRKRPMLRKLPIRVHYAYEIDTPAGTEEWTHRVFDWELGALFWNCQNLCGSDWEEPLRSRLSFEGCGLYLIMGTQHRFPDQWLIVGLAYPPLSTSGVSQPPLWTHPSEGDAHSPGQSD